jgi:hypothetical protein
MHLRNVAFFAKRILCCVRFRVCWLLFGRFNAGSNPSPPKSKLKNLEKYVVNNADLEIGKTSESSERLGLAWFVKLGPW